MSRKEPIVSVTGLTVAFGGRDVTHAIDLELYPGRITALVGESGSGKTVTAMALPRLEPAGAVVRGRASLLRDGESAIDLLSDKAPVSLIRGGLIGVVFQEPSTAFNPVFTVGSQIAEAVRSHANGKIHNADCKERVLRQLREVGLADAERIYGSYPHQLSGGQLQRAMIAMAIINRPQVLIADEPTTALDVTTQKGILTLLKELASTLSLAILLITHDMGVVRMTAQDVYVMQHGHIVEYGSVDKVFQYPQKEYTKVLLSAVPKLRVGGSAGSSENADNIVDSHDVVARLDNVSVEYVRGKKAVSNISFSLKRGHTNALVGESGAGKSTIAKVLSGQLNPAEGNVIFENLSLNALKGKKRRYALSHLGYVFQDSGSALNPRKTVAWSIAEPMQVVGGFSQDERRAKVYEMLDRVELPREVAFRYPHQLSGGQRQRVGIARSLVLRPDLLLADEPTSSLDVTVQRRILHLLHELQEEYGFACLFITHDLGIVQEVADEVTVMKDGHLVEYGAVGSVLRHPKDAYTKMLLEASPKFDVSNAS